MLNAPELFVSTCIGGNGGHLLICSGSQSAICTLDVDFEVWIDYKNAVYGYGYDYCKYEYYNDKTYTGTYSSIDSYAVNADAVGKEHTLNMYSKCSAEVYSVNIKDNTIQKKKQTKRLKIIVFFILLYYICK